MLRLIARLNMGGPAHQAALLSGRRFHPDRFETLLVHGSLAPGEESLAQEAEREGARMLWLPELRQPVQPVVDALALAKLVRLIRRFRPHVLHTHTAKAGFLGRQAAAMVTVPRPRLVHTYHGHVLEGYFSAPKSAVYRGLERHLARGTDVLIGVSQATVDDLVRLRIAPRSKFQVVRLGLDLERFTVDDNETREACREELRLEGNDLLCAFVGRIVPIKRVELLLEAVAIARREDARIKLVIVGDGELRAGLEGLATSLGLDDAVEFVGYKQDLVPIWSASDVAVLASANEGTPVSLIEAAAAGIPAVATDVGGVRETLSAGSAVIVPSGDAGALAAGITRYGADRELRASAGVEARRHALRNFGAARLIEDISGLYEDLVAGEGSPR